MPEKKKRPPVQQTTIGDGNVQVAGDNNIVNVNQSFTQRVINVFKGINIVINKVIRGESETTKQRNRRIMLEHVENFWVKGILEKSLHGAALLELGIKEDPDALDYPWAIRREASREILPADKSMLEIFQEIGMGRSLLILGAPGSGKTTMLLELTRQLIERAREDVTEPIPVVFNLSSWTEKLTLADWLAKELNVIYTIPKKVAPTWVRENKMLLLLDGLDEVRQESRDKCVDAINQFRKENGLTSMAVCSRIQDYVELKTRLSFDGAIEIQPLTLKQVDEYFERFDEELAGIRKVLEKDTALREMAETPLFVSIMVLAYHDIQGKDILTSNDLDVQHKYLFDTYIERMFERPERTKKDQFRKDDILRWLSWLAQNMIVHNQILYLIEKMQPKWMNSKHQIFLYGNLTVLLILMFLIFLGLWAGVIFEAWNFLELMLVFIITVAIGWKHLMRLGFNSLESLFMSFGIGFGFLLGEKAGIVGNWIIDRLFLGMISGLMFALSIRFIDYLLSGVVGGFSGETNLETFYDLFSKFNFHNWDIKTWNWQTAKEGMKSKILNKVIRRIIDDLNVEKKDVRDLDFSTANYLTWDWLYAIVGLLKGMAPGLLIFVASIALYYDPNNSVRLKTIKDHLVLGASIWIFLEIILALRYGFRLREINQTSYPGHWLIFSIRSSTLAFFLSGGISGIIIQVAGTLVFGTSMSPFYAVHIGVLTGLIFGIGYGGLSVVFHYLLRIIMVTNRTIPFRIISFLNYCVDLIFLRRVGGGYMFVHRLLMEHFAAMYQEEAK